MKPSTIKFRLARHSVIRYVKLITGAAVFLILTTASVDIKSFYEFTPQWPAPFVDILNSEILRFNGKVGLFLKDLQTGRTFALNADELFPSASLIKVPIMAGVLKKVADGELSLDTNLTLWREDKVGGSGILKRCRSGSRWSVERLLRLMISRSDNTATRLLVNALGTDFLNRTFESLGLEVTRVSVEPLFRLTPDVSVENYTTPREMARLLEKLYQGACVSPEASRLMLDFMEKGRVRHRLARYLPPRWKMADKTGMLRGAFHHVGIVYSPHGNFLICVLTSTNNDPEYARAKQFMANLGKKVFRYTRNNPLEDQEPAKHML